MGCKLEHIFRGLNSVGSNHMPLPSAFSHGLAAGLLRRQLVLFYGTEPSGYQGLVMGNPHIPVSYLGSCQCSQPLQQGERIAIGTHQRWISEIDAHQYVSASIDYMADTGTAGKTPITYK